MHQIAIHMLNTKEGDFHADSSLYGCLTHCLGFPSKLSLGFCSSIPVHSPLNTIFYFKALAITSSILWALLWCPLSATCSFTQIPWTVLTCSILYACKKVTTTSSFHRTILISWKFHLHLPCPQGWQCLGDTFHDTYSVQSSPQSPGFQNTSFPAQCKEMGLVEWCSWCQVNPGNPPGWPCCVISLPWTHNCFGYTLDNSTLHTSNSHYNPSSHFVSFTLPTEPILIPQFLCGLHSHHIKPISVMQYLSGIVNFLTPYFPDVRKHQSTCWSHAHSQAGSTSGVTPAPVTNEHWPKMTEVVLLNTFTSSD